LHPYRIAGIILGTLALFFLGFMAVGILLPSGWDAERTAVMPAEPESVLPFLVSPSRWTEWTPTPESGVDAFGPPEGPGAGHRWDDPAYGEGAFRITSVSPPGEVRYEVEVEGGSIRIMGHFVLEPTGDGSTLVHWREEGDFGWNPLLGYLASRMNELQGAQMEASLAALQAAVAAAVVPTGPGDTPGDGVLLDGVRLEGAVPEGAVSEEPAVRAGPD